MARSSYRLLVLAGILALVAGCAPSTTDSGKSGETTGAKAPPANLNGQGATFIEPIMKFWTNLYAEQNEGTQINYQGTGSGAGIAQMTKKLCDFGCSDAPMNKKQTDEAGKIGPVVHVPLVIGAVVPVYNLEGVTKPLVFSGPVLAEIFLGKIAKWNDPKIVELNPGQRLPDLAIQPVYRADPSGTSFIFSDFLAKVSPEFKTIAGTSTTPNWPEKIGIKQSKSDGVAGHIGRTVGAIGYVELTFALDTKATYGMVKNSTGKAILADLASITAAADASLDTKPTAEPYSLHELTYNLTNAPGENSYPIAGMSFGVIYQTLPAATGKATVAFFKWAASEEGQKYAAKRNYAPLPKALQDAVAARLDTVTFE